MSASRQLRHVVTLACVCSAMTAVAAAQELGARPYVRSAPPATAELGLPLVALVQRPADQVGSDAAQAEYRRRVRIATTEADQADAQRLRIVVERYAEAIAQEPGARGGGGGGRGGARGGGAPELIDLLNQVRQVETLTFVNRGEPVVRDAPYSGEGVTTVTQVLSDGTRIERQTSTRVWRDRMGRVRREQTAVGLGALAPNDSRPVITISDPVAGVSYTLDSLNRTARQQGLTANRAFTLAGVVSGLSIATPAPAGATPAGRTGGPGAPATESLGTRQVEGVKATGTRASTTIPLGQIGNDRAFQVTDERWESPELQVLVMSRQSDPRTGVVEYRLTNISRAEPPPDLFTVPPDYTVIAPGGRGGGPALAAPVAPGAGGGRGRGRSNSVDQFGEPPQN